MDDASQGHRGLIVWQRASDLAKLAYAVTETFPPAGERSLKSQIRRAAHSVPSNIGEGSGRGTKKDFLSFLRIARGSLRELDTHLETALAAGYVSQEDHQRLVEAATSTGKLLTLLIRKLSQPS